MARSKFHPYGATHIGLASAIIPVVVCLLTGCQPSSNDDTSGSSNTVASASSESSPDTSATENANLQTSKRTNKVEEISFDDIVLGMQPDVRFRPFMLTDRAKNLDGRPVRISGYMHGGVSQIRGIREFILLRNKECKFGPGGQADHLVQINLEDGITASYTSDVVEVEGILNIRPFHGSDGFTWSIYELAGTSTKLRR